MTLRSAKLQKEYNTALPGILKRGCPLCAEDAIRTFRFWKIIIAKFPFDLISKKHHIAVPLRHIEESELSYEELVEFRELKERSFEDDYEHVIDPTGIRPSIPGHFHHHLIVTKPEATV